MNFLEERIAKDGVVKEGNVLKVDSFLNHQMDIELFDEMGAEFKRRFANENVNKILTIEASGIGIACVVAQRIQLGGGLVCNPLLKILHQATHADLVGVILIEHPIEFVVLDFHRRGIIGCPTFNSLLCPGDAVDVRHVDTIKIIVGRYGKSALQLLHHLMRRYDPRPGLNPLAVDRRKAIT